MLLYWLGLFLWMFIGGCILIYNCSKYCDVLLCDLPIIILSSIVWPIFLIADFFEINGTKVIFKKRNEP